MIKARSCENQCGTRNKFVDVDLFRGLRVWEDVQCVASTTPLLSGGAT